MPYKIEFRPAAQRDIGRLPRAIEPRVTRAIGLLGEDPRPAGVKKLAGYTNRWRIRVGDYRVIYEVHDNRLLVLVISAAHRREAY